MRHIKIICFLAVMAAPLGAWAQGVLCTMPSGIVIRLSMSACPRDALKSEPDDGRVLPTRQAPVAQPQAQYPEVIAIPKAKPVVAPAPAAKERDIVEESYAICALLKLAGATTCKVNVNIFSASYLDATIATSPRDAEMTCLTVANKTRQPGSPFIGRGWELRIFSPMGNGTRPMAVCRL